MNRKFRYCMQGHGRDSLSPFEVRQLTDDYDIDTYGFHVLVPLTREEWDCVKTRQLKWVTNA